MFKIHLDVERYLLKNLNYTCRKILANFCCSGHNWQIEKGRHLNIAREFRFCPACLDRNVYVSEDIFHLFMVCPLYVDLRNIHFEGTWRLHVSVQKFHSIMRLTDVDSLISISKFLVSAFGLTNKYYISEK